MIFPLSFCVCPDAVPTNQEMPIYNVVAATLNRQNEVMKVRGP